MKPGSSHQRPARVAFVASSPSARIARQDDGRWCNRGHSLYLALSARQDAAQGVPGEDASRARALSDPAALHRSAVSLNTPRDPGIREGLESLDMSRTLVIGNRSPYRLPANLDPAIHQLVIPDAWHDMMLDNPDAFAKAIARLAVTTPL